MDLFNSWYASASGLLPVVSRQDAEAIFAAGVSIGAAAVDAFIPNLFSYGASLQISVAPTPSGYVAATNNFKARTLMAHQAIMQVAAAEIEHRKNKIILLGE